MKGSLFARNNSINSYQPATVDEPPFFSTKKEESVFFNGNSQSVMSGQHVVQRQGNEETTENASTLIEDFEGGMVCEDPSVSSRSESAFGDDEEVCSLPDSELIQDEYVTEYVQFAALVKAPKGIRLHTTPDPFDYDYQNRLGKSEMIYPRYSHVDVVARGGNDNGWRKVRTDDGQIGWIEGFFIKQYDPTDTRVWKFHFIEKGDMAITLVQKYYYDIFNIQYGRDERAVAEAIAHLNKGNSAVIHRGEYDSSFWKDTVFDRSMKSARENFETMKLVEGELLFLPTGEYIYTLIEQGTVSSRAGWKNTVFKIGRSIQGFLEGVVEGFIGAAVDTVKDLWSLVKSIFTGAIIDQAEQLIDQIQELGWAGIWNLLKEAFFGEIIKLKKFIEGENPQKKWWAIGKIVGMILFEIVVAFFTAGIGTAIKHSARVGKVLSRVQKVSSKIPGLGGIGNRKGPELNKIDNSKKQELLDSFEKREITKDESIGKSFSKDGKYLSNVELEGEVAWITNNAHLGRSSTITGYVEEIELPGLPGATEKHFWRKNTEGTWCRFSDPYCLTKQRSEELGLPVVDEKSARLTKTLDLPEPEVLKEIVVNNKTVKVHRKTNDPEVNMALVVQKNLLLDVSDFQLRIRSPFPERSLDPNFIPDEVLGKGNKKVPNTAGLSNRELAKQGKSPYLKNGNQVELHHTEQSFFGDIEEMSTGFHKSVDKDLDFHPKADDPAFISWRKEYGYFRGKMQTYGEIYDILRKEYWRNRWK